MNARNFYDTERRKLEMFMEEVEDGKHRPLKYMDPDHLTTEEWQAAFQVWQASPKTKPVPSEA